MSIRIYFMIIIAAVATAGFAQSDKQEIKRNFIPEEGVLSSRTVAHINTPVTRKLAGERYAFTDYDYAANNSIRPMVDWGDFDGDAEIDPIVTAMVRQNTGIREQLQGHGDPSGYNMENPFFLGTYGWGSIQFARQGPDADHVFIFAHSGGITHAAKREYQTQLPNEISTFGYNYPSFVYVDDGTIWATTTDNFIYKSVDGGSTFTQVVQIGSGDPNVNLSNAVDVPAEIPIQSSNNGQYIAVLGAWAGGTPSGEDIVYLYYSTNSGATWTGDIIGIDGVFGQISNRNYAPYFVNLGQVNLDVANSGIIHVTANGYGQNISSEIVVPALYWNSDIQNWIAMTDSAFESELDASGTSMTTPRIYSGNAMGNSYPGVTISDDGQVVFYIWEAPEYDASGNFRIYPGDGGLESGPIMFTDIKGRYSTDGGLSWSEILNIAAEPEVMEQFPSLPRRLEVDNGTGIASAHIVFQVDATPGASVFIGAVAGQNSPNNNTEWRYTKFSFPFSPFDGIIVTSPNGGEEWLVGNTRDITWISNVSNVKIEYTTNAGGTWVIITNSTPGTGSYQWIIPNTVADFCYIKISDAADPTISDQSNQSFKIVQPEINIISPDGGENWLVNSVQNIMWSANYLTHVKIEYSTNAGSSWSTVINSTPNSGNFSWTIPNTISSDCRIRISDVSNSSTFDISSNNFSIVHSEITVISPNGGESWLVGAIHPITWNSAYVGTVQIQYSTNSGSVWINITNSAASTGSYDWTVPATLSGNCKVRIRDIGNLSINDISDSNFTITQGSITVTAPNGGEVWRVGNSHAITWTSNDVSVVKIELSINNGVTWTEIISSAPSTGIYNWIVPNSISLQCRIRITDTETAAVTDLSDNVFSIELETSVEDWFSSVPTEYALYQNFPNPFNPATSIYYSIPEACMVNLTVYNLLGQKIAELINEYKEPGNYKIEFSLGEQNSGIYVYKINAGSYVSTKKMILMK